MTSGNEDGADGNPQGCTIAVMGLSSVLYPLLLICYVPLIVGQTKPGSVEGRVVNAVNGAPVKKARVTLRGPAMYVAATDSGGHFSFDGVQPASVYQLFAEGVGFTDPSGNWRPRQADVFGVKEGEHVTDKVIRFWPLGKIAGRVTDENGDPVRGVGVNIVDQTLNNLITADDRGEYRLFDLRPGRYYVFTSQGELPSDPPGTMHSTIPDRIYASSYYPGVDDPGQAGLVDLSPGTELNGIDFRVKKIRVYHVRGNVIGAGRPTEIDLDRAKTSDLRSVRLPQVSARDDGRFDIRGVPPGSYCAYATFAYVTAGNESQQTYAKQNVIVTDHDVEEMKLAMAPKVTLRGSVSLAGGDNGIGKMQGTVRLQPEESCGAHAASVRIDEDGTFILRNVVPGSYRISVQNGPGYLRTARLGDRELSKGKIEVPEGDSVLTLALANDYGWVEGDVQTGAGDPDPSALLTICPKGDYFCLHYDPSSSGTKPEGHFLEKLPPGDYEVFAFEDPSAAGERDPEFYRLLASQAQRVSVSPDMRSQVVVKVIPAPMSDDVHGKLR